MIGLAVVFVCLGCALIATLWKNPNDLGPAPVYSDSILVMTIMTLNFLGCFLFAVFGLRASPPRQREVEMKGEVLALVVFWTCCTMGFSYLMMYGQEKKLLRQQLLMVGLMSIILLRDIMSFIISIVTPVLKNPQGKIIPYGETRECVNNVEIALATELPFMYFARYVELVAGEKGRNLITLYTQIKLYEDEAENNTNQEDVYDMATAIQQEYVQANAPARLDDVPTEVTESLTRKFDSLRNYLDKHLFDSLYGIVINKLQEYFVAFQKSELHRHLYDELKCNEIVYDRLVYAELI